MPDGTDLDIHITLNDGAPVWASPAQPAETAREGESASDEV